LESGSSISTTGGLYTSARADRDPLLLPARQLVRQALGERAEAEVAERLRHPISDFARRDVAQAQPYATLSNTVLCGHSA
jgi:hypothetical protein